MIIKVGEFLFHVVTLHMCDVPSIRIFDIIELQTIRTLSNQQISLTSIMDFDNTCWRQKTFLVPKKKEKEKRNRSIAYDTCIYLFIYLRPRLRARVCDLMTVISLLHSTT